MLFPTIRVESLMPKGVEHSTGIISILVWLCVESLMPKGVEHNDGDGDRARGSRSVESLMPKGVEHKI